MHSQDSTCNPESIQTNGAFPYQLAPQKHGGAIRVWKMPEPGAKYVLGADASSGGIAGDPAAACVLETRSCDLVATIHTRRDPIPFGRMCAMLGWFYNTALLAIETHPSQHGISCVLAARDAGYPNLYRRWQLSTVHQKMTQELGWATTSKTKPLMVDAVRAALVDRCVIPDVRILHELRSARYQENDDLVFEQSNDDFFIAYAVALLVRRHAVQMGFTTPDGVEAVDERTLWWQHRKRVLKVGDQAPAVGAGGEDEPFDLTGLQDGC